MLNAFFLYLLDKMDSSLIRLLIENICLLLTSESREVVVSAMSFLKILFSVMDTSDLAEHVESMVIQGFIVLVINIFCSFCTEV